MTVSGTTNFAPKSNSNGGGQHMTEHRNLSGIARLAAALGNSWKGCRTAWRSEEAFRQEVVVLAILAPATLFLPLSGFERLLLIGAIIGVIIVELLNSAIEAAIDRIGPEHHILSGSAKDMSSAAVLLSLVMACLTWLTVLWTNFGPNW